MTLPLTTVNHIQDTQCGPLLPGMQYDNDKVIVHVFLVSEFEDNGYKFNELRLTLMAIEDYRELIKPAIDLWFGKTK